MSEETHCCVQQLADERVVQNMVHFMCSIKNAKEEVYLSQRVKILCSSTVSHTEPQC